MSRCIGLFRTGRGKAASRFCARFAIAAIMLAPPPAARAAVTAEDIQVAARVLGFTTTPLTGTVKLGIVYNPANAASVADERALLGILGGGLTVGNVTLVPVLVPVARVDMANANVLFLTSGLGAGAAPVVAAAAAKKLMCITTDMAAVQAGTCAVAVQSDPAVQITVNKAAASASGVSFVTAFLLMITEI
jgi:hypothetical protein